MSPMLGVTVEIALTHYRQWSEPNCTFEEWMTLEKGLADMCRRLREGAQSAKGMYSYGLITRTFDQSGDCTDWDKVIYSGARLQMNRIADFICQAAQWQEESGPYGSPEHDGFLRRRLLEATGHQLDPAALEVALAMVEDEFLAAIAMSLENDERVAELFRHPLVTTT